MSVTGLRGFGMAPAWSTGWRKYGSFRLPSLRQATVNRINVQPRLSSPVRYGVCAAIDFKNLVISAIVALLGPCGPLAVLFRIWTIAIATFQRMPWRWPFPDVAEECQEVALPFARHCNSSRSVPFVSGVLWIVTPGLCLLPGGVFGGLFLPMPKAPATQLPASFEVGCDSNCRPPTIANAFPSSAVSALRLKLPNGDEPTEPVPSQLKSVHKNDLFYQEATCL